MRDGAVIITNNPYVKDKLGESYPVIFKDMTYRDLLTDVRDRIHEGAVLMTHPLYGSVKPGETPYRSLIVKEKKGPVDGRSLSLIEAAIAACGKFADRTEIFRPDTLRDFQFVDYSLLMSGIQSSETY